MTYLPGGQTQQDDLVAQKSKIPPSENPIAGAASVTISVPESVEVRLVDASALGDYEIWVLLTSILSSAVTGFLVATVQATSAQRFALGVVTVVFGILMGITGATAMYKRRSLSTRTRRIRFGIGDPID